MQISHYGSMTMWLWWFLSDSHLTVRLPTVSGLLCSAFDVVTLTGLQNTMKTFKKIRGGGLLICCAKMYKIVFEGFEYMHK